MKCQQLWFALSSLIFVSGILLPQDSSYVALGRKKIEKKAAHLDSLYKKCITYPDSLELKMHFFAKFPSSFEEFEMIYGYRIQDTGTMILEYPGILIGKIQEHVVDLFGQLDCCIPEEEYYKKLIQLGINGKWEADAASYIQEKAREKVFQKPLLALKILTNLKTQEVESFFFFFFDEPHPAWKSVPQELNVIKKHNPPIYGLIEKSFKAALMQNEH